MQTRNGRRGSVFCLRLTDPERLALEHIRRRIGGPRALGPWLKWLALRPVASLETVLPELAGAVLPSRADRSSGNTPAAGHDREGTTPAPPIRERHILDLCGGSGAWSKPYADAGYPVHLVTLPKLDVRTLRAPIPPVWGVLAAPPCTEFSLAKNGQERDIPGALDVVGACLRIIHAARPQWWALENPVGLLRHWLGEPQDAWEPCDFGDPWTKRTAIWGRFTIPKRGPFVEPLGGGPFCTICDPGRTRFERCRIPDHIAITPPGFARAFYEANP